MFGVCFFTRSFAENKHNEVYLNCVDSLSKIKEKCGIMIC